MMLKKNEHYLSPVTEIYEMITEGCIATSNATSGDVENSSSVDGQWDNEQ